MTRLSLYRLLRPFLKPTPTTLSSIERRLWLLSLKISIDRLYFLSICTFLMQRIHKNRKAYSIRLTCFTQLKSIPSLLGYIRYYYFTTLTGRKSFTGKDFVSLLLVATNKHPSCLIRSCLSIQTTHNATSWIHTVSLCKKSIKKQLKLSTKLPKK